MLSNLSETLHSSAKCKPWQNEKNKQVAKIWGLWLKKQRFGDKLWFPEGLGNTPLKTIDQISENQNFLYIKQ